MEGLEAGSSGLGRRYNLECFLLPDVLAMSVYVLIRDRKRREVRTKRVRRKLQTIRQEM